MDRRSRSEGKRTLRYKEEDDDDEEEEEEEEEDEEVAREKSYGEDDEEYGTRKRAMADLYSSKKGSNKAGSSAVPRSCQVESCDSDLSYAKHYHQRHKVCEYHSKAPSVLIGGQHQRFCQQCSRFHELSEFDESKRSCRRRLAGHNERRRKNAANYHGE